MNVTKIILTLQMPYFLFKMHQIQLRLRLSPDPAGELTAGFGRGRLKRKGRRGRKREKRGGERKGEGEGIEARWKGGTDDSWSLGEIDAPDSIPTLMLARFARLDTVLSHHYAATAEAFD